MGYLDLIHKREQEAEGLRGRALEEAEGLSQLLKEKYSFDALYLIGSVLSDGFFSRNSDIDLVVKGLHREDFFKALALLISSSTYAIDLKPYEELDENSRSMIEQAGRVLQ